MRKTAIQKVQENLEKALKGMALYEERHDKQRERIAELEKYKASVEAMIDAKVDELSRSNGRLFHLVRVALKDPYLFESAKTLTRKETIEREEGLFSGPAIPRQLR